MNRKKSRIVAAVLLAGIAVPALADLKEGDVNLGNLNGQLWPVYGGDPVDLPPYENAMFGLLGIGLDEPGFFGITDPANTPDGVIQPLDPNANLRLVVVGFSPALKAWGSAAPLFGPLLQNPGDFWNVGSFGPDSDEHPFWFIDKNDPAYNGNDLEWTAQVRFVDTAGVYGDSPVVTLRFTPEPTTAALLALAGLAVRRVNAKRRVA